ncbi:MAG: helix-turn-helix transcriptional regulator [Acidimicrobiia bacterium]
MDDFLTELIHDRSAANERFAELVEAAFQRRELIRQLAAIRAERAISQTELAALMGTSQSAVARLESGDSDARASTLGRYAAALGHRIEFSIVDESPKRSGSRGRKPKVVTA